MSDPVQTKNPLQTPRVEEIRAGKKFWGYLDSEVMRSRYAMASYFVRGTPHVIEIGGYRDNVITHFLSGPHESVSVYSLDAEFDELEAELLNGHPCRIRHVRDFFQNYEHPMDGLGVVALGLEIIGDMAPLYRLLGRAQVSVLEVAADHAPSQAMMAEILAQRGRRVRAQIDLDFTANERLLAPALAGLNMNTPFWRRTLYVLAPPGAPDDVGDHSDGSQPGRKR